MLTNNKKRSFVKLIALTLAALMVFSVCLTGCTDQDARDQAADALNKAENAQSVADAAQTAEEVAAAIAKALEGYYKGDADDIKALIAAELKDVVTADDLTKYAEKTALDDLTKKVNGITTGLTEAQVKTLIQQEMANYAIDQKIADALKNGSSLSAAAVKKLIQDALDAFKLTLNDYVKKDDLDKYVTDDELAAYFKGEDGKTLTPAQVYTVLSTMVEEYPGEHMSAAEWDKVTGLVIETLNLAGSFINADLINNYYLDENKYLINTYSGITMYPSIGNGADGKAYTEDDNYGEYDAAAADAALAVLALKILRAPDKATIEAIKDGFVKAAAVPSFKEDMAPVIAKLYALGKLAQLDDDKNGTAEKYGAATKYHGVDYAKDADILYQVVTDADKAAFAAIQNELDALLLHYAADLDDRTVNPFFFKVSDIYVKYDLKKDDGTVLQTVTVKASDYAGNAYSAAAAVDAKTLNANAASSALVANSYTIGVDTIVATAAAVFTATAPVAGKHMVGYFDDFADPALPDGEPAIKVDAAGYNVTGQLADALNYCNVTGDVAVAETYAAIIQMLADVDAAMTAAENTFKAFLTHVAGADKADSVYEAALKDYMCTSQYIAGAIYVPNDWRPGDPQNPGQYLLEQVAYAFNYAANIRGGTTDGLYKYDLYLKLKGLANGLLFEQFRDKALDVLNIMMNDYITAVEAAKLAVANSTAPETEATNAVMALGLSASGTWVAGEKWSPNFVEKFYEDGGEFSWNLGTPNQKMIGLNQFLTSQGAAYVPNATYTANEQVICDILDVLAENAIAIKHELSAATIGPRTAILTADVNNLAADADVTKAFNGYLDTAKTNMDEIIYRKTYEEIKEGVLNSLYALVTGDVDFDTFFNNGIAFFYNDGNDDSDPATAVGYYNAIAKALEIYLTGYSKTADAYGVSGEACVAVTVKTLADKKLPDGLVSPDQENPTMDYAATAKVKEVLGVRKAAVEDMENIAIKLRFGDYLDEARRTLWFTYHAYKVNAQDYAMSNKVTQVYNDHLNEISGIEYKIYMSDGRDLSVYKNAYIDLLHIVMRHNSTYAPLLGNKTVAQWISEQAKSKDAVGYTDIIRPTAPFAGAPEYYSAGSAIGAFDQAFNANAYKMDGNNKIMLYP